ncbi:unnamed protein product [Darwinula stevensoni]|uniref:Uncharacterized protein n=1 Tax=Darwinula stevensoni TaxID=69355 RepID=A0A7R8XI49_9CRUS|nr:unnamed protein product [Darwinula stevensoni]CAG0893502.1 unnamed protein product [Darwinula stevensoni]
MGEIWMAVFLAGAALTVYSVHLVVADYLSYPVITYVSMSHARKMVFPAVTVCNSNPIVCYKLTQLRDLLPELWNVSGCTVEDFMLSPVFWLLSPYLDREKLKNAIDGYLQETVNTTELALTVVDQGNSYTENSSLLDLMSGTNKQSRLDGLLKSLLYVAPVEFKARNGSRAFDILMAYLIRSIQSSSPQSSTTAASLSTTTLNASSENASNQTSQQRRKRAATLQSTTSSPVANQDGLHGFGVEDISVATEDYLNSCTVISATTRIASQYGTIGANSHRNFQVMLIPQYGTCFMFNTAWNSKDSSGGKRISSKTGEESGLSLELYLDQISYIKNPTASSVGARVTIHSPNEWPNPVEQGYLVQPNTRNVFALQAVDISRLESPYSTDCFSDWNQTDYKPFSMDNPNATLDYSLVQCERLRETAEIAKNCHCLNPEIQDNFLHNGVSYLGYPMCNISIGVSSCIRYKREAINDTLSDLMQEDLLSRAVYKLGYEDAFATVRNDPVQFAAVKEQLKKDMLKVEVFFRSLNLQVIQEQPKYDLNGLVSNLGGVFGIYLGMCVVMLIEVVEFIVVLIIDIIRHFFGKDSRESELEKAWRGHGNPDPSEANPGKRRGFPVSPGPDAYSRAMASLHPVAHVHYPRQGQFLSFENEKAWRQG